MHLKGKVAVVTGSTSGIGLGIAEELAKVGAYIMLNGFGDAAEIEKTRHGLSSRYGIKVGYHGADMSKPDQVRDLIQKTQTDMGSVDILVNNAGIQYVAPIEEFPEQKWDSILAINLSSAFHATKAAVPGMKARKWGRIINVASAHGLVASTGKAAYVAAKHGIVGLTKVTALENAGSGITAVAVCPGWVLTPLVQKQIDDNAKKAGISVHQAQEALLSEKQPSKQFATPEQFGQLIAFLCSAAADQITGTTISVDGGWTAQ